MKNPKTAILRSHRKAGFTLVEVMIATGLAIIVGTGAYTLLSATLKLYAENFSLNHSHQSARLPLERMILDINNAGSSPILVDEKGADIGGVEDPVGSGVRWAPGIRFCTLVSSSRYVIRDSAGPTATSVKIEVDTSGGQPKPRESDILLVHASQNGQLGTGIQVEISGISGTSNPYTVTLKSALGVTMPAYSSALILQQGAFIVKSGQLRYYNKVMSEARHGAANFNAPGNFRALAQLEPAPGQPMARPFGYATSEDRVVRVNLRAKTARHANRVADFNSFLNMQSSIAVKSAYLDPTKLGAIK